MYNYHRPDQKKSPVVPVSIAIKKWLQIPSVKLYDAVTNLHTCTTRVHKRYTMSLVVKLRRIRPKSIVFRNNFLFFH